MVRNLMKAGFEVSIYARTKAKVEDVLQEGALWCNSIGSCAAGKDAVITIVGFPKDVEEVYFAEGNILDSAAAGTYLIDMTTTSPQLAIRIYEKQRKTDSTRWMHRLRVEIQVQKRNTLDSSRR